MTWKDFTDGSWKTTVAGIAGAIGLAMTAWWTFSLAYPGSAPAWMGGAGLALAALAKGLGGAVTRDNDKTSEQVDAPKAIGAVPGPRGPKGEPGAAGPEGEAGEKGATGRAGAKAGK